MDNDKLKKKIIKFICVALIFLCIIIVDHIKESKNVENVNNNSINTETSIVEVGDTEDSNEVDNEDDKDREDESFNDSKTEKDTLDESLNNSDTDNITTDKLSESDENNVNENNDSDNAKNYTFRTQSQFDGHFEKHGEEVGCKSKEEYLAAANAVINNPNALHKLEAEDDDHIYYLEDTDEIVFLSQDGYIRTYFICSGKAYYDRQ